MGEKKPSQRLVFIVLRALKVPLTFELIINDCKSTLHTHFQGHKVEGDVSPSVLSIVYVP